MKKGTVLTEENLRAAFKEAGFEDVNLHITPCQGGRSKHIPSIEYSLPDGAHGKLMLADNVLPSEPKKRTSLIRHAVNRTRRALHL